MEAAPSTTITTKRVLICDVVKVEARRDALARAPGAARRSAQPMSTITPTKTARTTRTITTTPATPRSEPAERQTARRAGRSSPNSATAPPATTSVPTCGSSSGCRRHQHNDAHRGFERARRRRAAERTSHQRRAPYAPPHKANETKNDRDAEPERPAADLPRIKLGADKEQQERDPEQAEEPGDVVDVPASPAPLRPTRLQQQSPARSPAPAAAGRSRTNGTPKASADAEQVEEVLFHARPSYSPEQAVRQYLTSSVRATTPRSGSAPLRSRP